MKYTWILLAVLCLTALFLVSCHSAKNPADPSDTGLPPADFAPEDLVRFSYSHSGSMADQCYTFSLWVEDGIYWFSMEELFSGGSVLQTPIEEQTLLEVGRIVAEYRMDLWDGFEESSSLLLDGDGFSVEMEFADGHTVSARGYGCTPDGYGPAMDSILEMYLELLTKYDELAITETE